MTQEEKYRKLAKVFLRRIKEARQFFGNHKPSIGFAGEYILRNSLHTLVSQSYGICQGFVTYNGEISRQCDVIIYTKAKASIHKSYGELKIVNAESVAAVIEVKSSLSKETFYTTLKAFEQLERFGVTDSFLFVYGKLTRKSINSWYRKYSLPKANNCERVVSDTELYDWPDKEWLPNSILSLASCKYYRLGHIQNEYNDWVGYAAYKIIDKDNKEVSCLQEFFATIKDLLAGTLELVQDNYSIKDGFPLFRL